MSDFADRIREAVNDPARALGDVRKLSQSLGVTKKTFAEFCGVIERLREEGVIHVHKDGTIRRPSSTNLVRGSVRKTASGSAFITPDTPRPEYADGLYVRGEDLKDAATGDEVLVRVVPRGHRPGRPMHAKVVEVVARATRTFVGTYFERKGKGFVRIDGTDFLAPISVGDPGAKGALPDDKVVVELLRFPSAEQGGEGVLVEVLGPRGTPGVDTRSVIAEYGLPDSFPAEVLEEARVETSRFDEAKLDGRIDLTRGTVVTIDPWDARDFDDAISLDHHADGTWRLGVHIADVSHFVPVGSKLDDEAKKRGTSVYLPDRVLPMLPELISNGLASLQQGRVRYTQSAFIDFTADGMPTHSEFHRTAIRVTRRFAYEQVLPLIEGRGLIPLSEIAATQGKKRASVEDAPPAKHVVRSASSPSSPPPDESEPVSQPVLALLQRMHTLAMLLRKRRFARGALELNMPEVKIDLDRQGRVDGAHVAPHDASHQIIEEFMLAANIAVAEALVRKQVPFLRRAHGDPDPRKSKLFGEFVATLGFPLKNAQSRPELQQLLDKTRGTPLEQAVHYAFLRSMKQAEYSPEVVGHYALAAEHYCHFTSPIRRYPDLHIHRLFPLLIQGAAPPRQPAASARDGADPTPAQHTDTRPAKPDPQALATLGRHCSKTERRAADAERELIKLKLLGFLSTRIGLELDAIITGVKDYGFFCQGITLPAEGLVPVTTFTGDFYDYDDRAHTLTGRRKGTTWRLGDRIVVRVAKVDLDRRKLDFEVLRKSDGTPSSTSPFSSQSPTDSPTIPRPPRAPKPSRKLDQKSKRPPRKSSRPKKRG
jgi:ribonuclease R